MRLRSLLGDADGDGDGRTGRSVGEAEAAVAIEVVAAAVVDVVDERASRFRTPAHVASADTDAGWLLPLIYLSTLNMVCGIVKG